jgi:hypothetical protein
VVLDRVKIGNHPNHHVIVRRYATASSQFGAAAPVTATRTPRFRRS